VPRNFFENRNVEQIVRLSAGNTATLVFCSLGFALVVSLLLAVFAQRSGPAMRRFEMISLVILSLPTLLVAPLAIFIFGFQNYYSYT
jgi:ABC-type dipeptide/oligopeptide/nickel transport system permease component